MDSPEPTLTPLSSAPSEQRQWKAVAPVWHTLLLIAILLLTSFAMAPRVGETVAKHGRMQMYVTTMIFEWLMVLYVWWGMRKTGTRLREVIGGKWNAPEDALIDIALAFGVWLVVLIFLGLLGWAMGLTKNTNVEEARKSILVMLPQSGVEVAVFAAVSATAGFCEEIIFRGYFLRQFAGWSGLLWVGVAVQAVLFGCGHGYEGWQRMILIAIEGVILAAVALWRKSLRPVMGAHFLQDFVIGAMGRLLVKTLK